MHKSRADILDTSAITRFKRLSEVVNSLSLTLTHVYQYFLYDQAIQIIEMTNSSSNVYLSKAVVYFCYALTEFINDRDKIQYCVLGSKTRVQSSELI